MVLSPIECTLCQAIQRGRKEIKSEGAKQSVLAGVKGPCFSRGVRGMLPPEKFYDLDLQIRNLSHSRTPE